MSTSDDIADDIVVVVAGYNVLSIISQNSNPTEVYTSMLGYIYQQISCCTAHTYKMFPICIWCTVGLTNYTAYAEIKHQSTAPTR